MRKADYIERAQYFEMRERECRHMAENTIYTSTAEASLRLAHDYQTAARDARRHAAETPE